MQVSFARATERLQLSNALPPGGGAEDYREQKDLRPGIRDVRDGTLTRWAKTVVQAGMVTSSHVSFVSSREPWTNYRLKRCAVR